MTGVQRGSHDDPNLTEEELLAQRTAWFEAYTAQRNVFAPAGEELYSCPCCGHRTLTERGVYEICPECGWEDDGQDDHDSGVIRGGPNGSLSLDMARSEYVAQGGTRQPHTPQRRRSSCPHRSPDIERNRSYLRPSDIGTSALTRLVLPLRGPRLQ